MFQIKKKMPKFGKKKKVVEQKLFTQIRYYNVFITEKGNFNYFIFKHFFFAFIDFFFCYKKIEQK